MDHFPDKLCATSVALPGNDDLCPRGTNAILAAYLQSRGIPAENNLVNYTPFGQADRSTIVSDVIAPGDRCPSGALIRPRAPWQAVPLGI